MLAGSADSVVKAIRVVVRPLSGVLNAESAKSAELISEDPFRLLCVLCVNCVVGSGFQLTSSRQLIYPP